MNAELIYTEAEVAILRQALRKILPLITALVPTSHTQYVIAEQIRTAAQQALDEV